MWDWRRSQLNFALLTTGDTNHQRNLKAPNTSDKVAGIFWTSQAASSAATTSGAEKLHPDDGIMTPAPSQPKLTPQFCFSTEALKDFLRTSRSAIDDSITQNLNALVTPATAGFDPASTARRSTGPVSRHIDPRACQGFKDKALFPTWQARSHVLSYCAVVATSTDPDDSELAVRDAEDEQNREKVVNERLDPYSARYFPREPRTEKLAAILQLENGVENIVRTRTWGLVKERCGESAENWEDAFARWRVQAAAAARLSSTQQS